MTNEFAIKVLKELRGYGDKFANIGYDRKEALEMAIKALEQVRPKGVWLKRDYWSEGVGMGETYGYYYQCSECKKMVKGGYISCDDKFCSKCGAEMRGSEE